MKMSRKCLITDFQEVWSIERVDNWSWVSEATGKHSAYTERVNLIKRSCKDKNQSAMEMCVIPMSLKALRASNDGPGDAE